MKRLAHVDMLRGVAIVMMVIYHFLFQAVWMGLWELDLDADFWIVWARVTQFLFLGLVGVSVYLSRRGFVGQLKRGAFVFGLGLLISLVSYVMFPSEWVRFGVLHLIGVAIPLTRLVKGRPRLALGLAFVIWALGLHFDGQLMNFSSLDYFPIFPWLAVPFVGLALGPWVKRWSVSFDWPWLGWLGRQSLWIYLLHLPLIYFALQLFVLG